MDQTKKTLEPTAEDLAKVARLRSKHESSIKVEPEQLFIAEFGKHYGWAGVMAILNNEIDGETAAWLMEGARKVGYRQNFENAKSVLIGSGAAQSKKPSQTFKSATSAMIKQAKADM